MQGARKDKRRGRPNPSRKTRHEKGGREGKEEERRGRWRSRRRRREEGDETEMRKLSIEIRELRDEK